MAVNLSVVFSANARLELAPKLLIVAGWST